MGFKTITIKEDVYEIVKKAKRAGESFSDLFERTFKDDAMDFAGAWSDMSDEEYSRIKKEIRKFREGFAKSAAERENSLYGEK